MHGDELVGYVLSLRLIDFILSNYGSDPEIDRIVDELEIWINPLANPDGAYFPNKNTSVDSARRTNINGTDLNRNFPEVPDANPEDLSSVEPENIHMIRFLEKHRFNLSANMHSGAEVVNYPWDYDSLLHPDDDWYRFISREYADGVHAVEPNYMIGIRRRHHQRSRVVHHRRRKAGLRQLFPPRQGGHPRTDTDQKSCLQNCSTPTGATTSGASSTTSVRPATASTAK